MSPLRYPGGKGKLAAYLKAVIRSNRLFDRTYVEPFAGGGGVGLALLLNGYVNHIVLNDLSRPIYAFWHAILYETNRFEERISTVALTINEWEQQRNTFRAASSDLFDLGFATFYLNRTNHSGVLNGGMIGGYSQKSTYGLDARFNRQELVARVRRIGKNSRRITIRNDDAASLLQDLPSITGEPNPLLYIDPPYYTKGRDLYYDFYSQEDHTSLRDVIDTLDNNVAWVVSYDNASEIARLYSHRRSLVYDLSYSVRNGRVGRELMFFSDHLMIPDLSEGGLVDLQAAA
ncbi:DNA adenine methylase [Caulobacter sp. S45]|uniref:DNA adenine methylase n=1 Tax=Caulobacter sp. S45 TaxID=1641861 RepID=UPI00157762DB|nr:DNA adenine methylase [Caulobacter sp. S45]